MSDGNGNSIKRVLEQSKNGESPVEEVLKEAEENRDSLSDKRPKQPDRAPEPEKSGSIRGNVVVQGDKVVIRFETAVKNITLSPEHAAAMGQAIIRCANVALNNRKVIIIR